VKRRDFITLLVGAAAAYPLAAHAQQTMRHVVVIMITPETDAPGQGRLKAFLQAFEKLGWIDRHNVRIDIRWAGDSPERMSEIVAETLALKPDVVLGDHQIEPGRLHDR
jgi:putative ABC transport system substrate-binding protein